MSPFRRKDRPNEPWRIWVTLPGLGRVGPWSSGTRDRRQARVIEQWLRELALTRPELIRGVVEGHYSLRDLWAAKVNGGLDGLLATLKDPPLAEVVGRFQGVTQDRRVVNGLAQVLKRAPKGSRLSWLTTPKNISDLAASMVAEGYAPMGVQRSVIAGISSLLGYELGKPRARAILSDVVKPSANNRRDVRLTPGQIERLLAECEPDTRDAVALALLTGADQGVILALTVNQWDPRLDALHLADTKNDTRPRTLQVPTAAAAILRRRVAAARDERLFDVTAGALWSRWDAARKRAGLGWLTFKDLRHVAATYAAEYMSHSEIMAYLGHSNPNTSQRYLASQAQKQRAKLDQAAADMGLGRMHLKAQEGGA